MLRYLLDTNLCIRLLRDRPAGLRERFNAAPQALAISTIVLSELLFGAEKSGRADAGRREVEAFAARIAVLVFDADAASHSAEIRWELACTGRTIGSYDLLIAGHARSRGLIVITGNLGEFALVAGLRCEDWTIAGG